MKTAETREAKTNRKPCDAEQVDNFCYCWSSDELSYSNVFSCARRHRHPWNRDRDRVRSGDVGFLAQTARVVVLADMIFTASAVVVQPLTGYLLVRKSGQSFSEFWISAALVLYAVAGISGFRSSGSRRGCETSRRPPQRLESRCRTPTTAYSASGSLSVFLASERSWRSYG